MLERSESASSTRVVLGTLLVIYIFNFLDRQIVAILAEPIKRDLGLTDTQLGLMTGLAFALFYTLLGIPIARYADRPKSNRVGLISLSVGVWSAMTMACGMAQSYAQLLLARVGVGVGEAGCTPAAHSLISDIVPKEKRNSAMAIYGLGIPIGGLLGMMIGGVIADAYGWRTAFYVAGLPGLALAIAVPFLIKEPRRSGTMVAMLASRERLPTREALGEVFRSRAFLLIAVAAGVTAFLNYGKAVWNAVFFMRTHGLSAGETGLMLGAVIGISGMLGTWLGGMFADRYGAQNRRHILTAPVVGMIIAAPVLFATYNATDWRIAMTLMVVPAILNAMYYGPTYACAQGLVRPEARAVASSVMIFAQNLIGLGLGPLFFGMMSDAFRPYAGDESVRWVLFGAAWLGLIPAFFYWRASLRLNAEMKSG